MIPGHLSRSVAPKTLASLMIIGMAIATPWAPAHAATSDEQKDLRAIPALDVPRYMGRWYEISKYPNRFQKYCTGDTTATYELLPDKTVSVVNRCRTDKNEIDEASGIARQIGDADSPKLEVRFAPAWLGFVPFVWGDYWVVDLDEDYQLAAVSEPGRDYLWILSRTPKVETAKRAELLDRLAAMGFDTARLEATPQSAAP